VEQFPDSTNQHSLPSVSLHGDFTSSPPQALHSSFTGFSDGLVFGDFTSETVGWPSLTLAMPPSSPQYTTLPHLLLPTLDFATDIIPFPATVPPPLLPLPQHELDVSQTLPETQTSGLFGTTTYEPITFQAPEVVPRPGGSGFLPLSSSSTGTSSMTSSPLSISSSQLVSTESQCSVCNRKCSTPSDLRYVSNSDSSLSLFRTLTLSFL
jgi:hypothetical protein